MRKSKTFSYYDNKECVKLLNRLSADASKNGRSESKQFFFILDEHYKREKFFKQLQRENAARVKNSLGGGHPVNQGRGFPTGSIATSQGDELFNNK